MRGSDKYWSNSASTRAAVCDWLASLSVSSSSNNYNNNKSNV